MVIPSGQEEKATTPDRLNSLPSFTLKGPTKKRTNTRNRNMEPGMNHAADAMASEKQTSLATPPRTSGSESDGDGDDIEAVRPKLVMRLKINMMNDAGLENEKEDERQETTPPSPPKNVLPWNLRTRRAKREDDNELRGDEKNNKMQKAKLRIELTKKEIEEDFMAMLGHPPPRKPNKRPKAVQNQLDNVFPGLYLKEITAKSYKVSESRS